MNTSKKMISVVTGAIASLFFSASIFALSPPVEAQTIRVEAEDFIDTTSNSARAQATSDVGGGQNLGWVQSYDSFVYEVYAPVSGSYNVDFRVASIYSNGDIAEGFYIAEIPNTGNWQQYVTLTARETVELEAGRNEIEFEFINRGHPYVANVNWIEFSLEGSSSGVIKFEAEDYVSTTSDSVRRETTGDDGGGYNLGFIEDGDTFTYEIDVPTSGVYKLEARLASENDEFTYMAMYVDGTYEGSIDMPNTGDWQEYVTEEISGIYLEAGLNTLEFSTLTRGPDRYLGNINWFTLTKTGN